MAGDKLDKVGVGVQLEYCNPDAVAPEDNGTCGAAPEGEFTPLEANISLETNDQFSAPGEKTESGLNLTDKFFKAAELFKPKKPEPITINIATINHDNLMEALSTLQMLETYKEVFEYGMFSYEGLRGAKLLVEYAFGRPLTYDEWPEEISRAAQIAILTTFANAEKELRGRIINFAVGLVAPQDLIIGPNPSDGINFARAVADTRNGVEWAYVRSKGGGVRTVVVNGKEVNYQHLCHELTKATDAGEFAKKLGEVINAAHVTSVSAGIERFLSQVKALQSGMGGIRGNILDNLAQTTSDKDAVPLQASHPDYEKYEAENILDQLAVLENVLASAEKKLKQGKVGGAKKLMLSVEGSEYLKKIPGMLGLERSTEARNRLKVTISSIILASALMEVAGAYLHPVLLDTFGTSRGGLLMSDFTESLAGAGVFETINTAGGILTGEPLPDGPLEFGKDILYVAGMFKVIGSAMKVYKETIARALYTMAAWRLIARGTITAESIATKGAQKLIAEEAALGPFGKTLEAGFGFTFEAVAFQGWEYVKGEIELHAFGKDVTPDMAFEMMTAAEGAKSLAAIKFGMHFVGKPAMLPVREAAQRHLAREFNARLIQIDRQNIEIIGRISEKAKTSSNANLDAELNRLGELGVERLALMKDMYRRGLTTPEKIALAEAALAVFRWRREKIAEETATTHDGAKPDGAKSDGAKEATNLFDRAMAFGGPVGIIPPWLRGLFELLKPKDKTAPKPPEASLILPASPEPSESQLVKPDPTTKVIKAKSESLEKSLSRIATRSKGERVFVYKTGNRQTTEEWVKGHRDEFTITEGNGGAFFVFDGQNRMFILKPDSTVESRYGQPVPGSPGLVIDGEGYVINRGLDLYNLTNRTLMGGFTDAIKARLEAYPDDTVDVLDIGCGTGRAMRELLRSEKLTDAERKRLRIETNDLVPVEPGTSHTHHVGRFEDLDLGGKRYDAITSIFGSHDVVDETRFLDVVQKTIEMLKPGGEARILIRGINSGDASPKKFLLESFNNNFSDGLLQTQSCIEQGLLVRYYSGETHYIYVKKLDSQTPPDIREIVAAHEQLQREFIESNNREFGIEHSPGRKWGQFSPEGLLKYQEWLETSDARERQEIDRIRRDVQNGFTDINGRPFELDDYDLVSLAKILLRSVLNAYAENPADFVRTIVQRFISEFYAKENREPTNKEIRNFLINGDAVEDIVVLIWLDQRSKSASPTTRTQASRPSSGQANSDGAISSKVQPDPEIKHLHAGFDPRPGLRQGWEILKTGARRLLGLDKLSPDTSSTRSMLTPNGQSVHLMYKGLPIQMKGRTKKITVEVEADNQAEMEKRANEIAEILSKMPSAMFGRVRTIRVFSKNAESYGYESCSSAYSAKEKAIHIYDGANIRSLKKDVNWDLHDLRHEMAHSVENERGLEEGINRAIELGGIDAEKFYQANAFKSEWKKDWRERWATAIAMYLDDPAKFKAGDPHMANLIEAQLELTTTHDGAIVPETGRPTFFLVRREVVAEVGKSAPAEAGHPEAGRPTSELFKPDPTDRLKEVWRTTNNVELPEDKDPLRIREMPVEGFSRLEATLRELVQEQINRGVAQNDIVVCVAGHAYFAQTIKILLRMGVRVVSRESSANQKALLDFDDGELLRARDSGKLILSPYDRETDPKEYDIKIWEHPNPVAEDFVASRVGKLVESVKDGGIFILQTDRPELLDSLRGNNEWTLLLRMPVTDANYLVPTAFISTIDPTSNGVGIFKREATTHDGANSDGAISSKVQPDPTTGPAVTLATAVGDSKVPPAGLNVAKGLDPEQRYVVIVDAYSTAAQFAEQFEKLGYKVIHVHSTAQLPWWYGTPKDADFVFDGDVAKLASELKKYHIDAVINGTDYALDVADRLSEALGVPNNDISLSRARRDKYEQVLALEKAGVSVPKTFATGKIDEALQWIENHKNWPVVVKPLEAAGSEGVYICRNTADVEGAFRALVGKKTTEGIAIDRVLVQEYLDGEEYIIDLATSRGKHIVTDGWKYKKTTVQKPGGGTTHIREYNELIPVSNIDPALIEYAKQVATALGVKNGPTHIEIIITKDGPRLVELNPRIAGADAPKYVEAAGGENPAFVAAMGLVRPDLFEQQVARARANEQPGRLVRLISTQSGKIKSIPFIDRLRTLQSYSSHHIAEVGDTLSPTIDLDTCPGTIFLTHANAKQIERDTKQIRKWEKEGFFVVEPEKAPEAPPSAPSTPEVPDASRSSRPERAGPAKEKPLPGMGDDGPKEGVAAHVDNAENKFAPSGGKAAKIDDGADDGKVPTTHDGAKSDGAISSKVQPDSNVSTSASVVPIAPLREGDIPRPYEQNHSILRDREDKNIGIGEPMTYLEAQGMAIWWAIDKSRELRQSEAEPTVKLYLSLEGTDPIRKKQRAFVRVIVEQLRKEGLKTRPRVLEIGPGCRTEIIEDFLREGGRVDATEDRPYLVPKVPVPPWVRSRFRLYDSDEFGSSLDWNSRYQVVVLNHPYSENAATILEIADKAVEPGGYIIIQTDFPKDYLSEHDLGNSKYELVFVLHGNFLATGVRLGDRSVLAVYRKVSDTPINELAPVPVTATTHDGAKSDGAIVTETGRPTSVGESASELFKPDPTTAAQRSSRPERGQPPDEPPLPGMDEDGSAKGVGAQVREAEEKGDPSGGKAAGIDSGAKRNNDDPFSTSQRDKPRATNAMQESAMEYAPRGRDRVVNAAQLSLKDLPGEVRAQLLEAVRETDSSGYEFGAVAVRVGDKVIAPASTVFTSRSERKILINEGVLRTLDQIVADHRDLPRDGRIIIYVNHTHPANEQMTSVRFHTNGRPYTELSPEDLDLLENTMFRSAVTKLRNAGFTGPIEVWFGAIPARISLLNPKETAPKTFNPYIATARMRVEPATTHDGANPDGATERRPTPFGGTSDKEAPVGSRAPMPGEEAHGSSINDAEMAELEDALDIIYAAPDVAERIQGSDYKLYSKADLLALARTNPVEVRDLLYNIWGNTINLIKSAVEAEDTDAYFKELDAYGDLEGPAQRTAVLLDALDRSPWLLRAFSMKKDFVWHLDEVRAGYDLYTKYAVSKAPPPAKTPSPDSDAGGTPSKRLVDVPKIIADLKVVFAAPGAAGHLEKQTKTTPDQLIQLLEEGDHKRFLEIFMNYFGNNAQVIASIDSRKIAAEMYSEVREYVERWRVFVATVESNPDLKRYLEKDELFKAIYPNLRIGLELCDRALPTPPTIPDNSTDGETPTPAPSTPRAPGAPVLADVPPKITAKEVDVKLREFADAFNALQQALPSASELADPATREAALAKGREVIARLRKFLHDSGIDSNFGLEFPEGSLEVVRIRLVRHTAGNIMNYIMGDFSGFDEMLTTELEKDDVGTGLLKEVLDEYDRYRVIELEINNYERNIAQASDSAQVDVRVESGVWDWLNMIHPDSNFAHVIFNLITNVGKYRPESMAGKPSLRIHRVESYHGTGENEKYNGLTALAFEDNAGGIPDEVSGKIGKERVHGDKTKPGGGDGLLFSYEIIEKSGGKVWFDTVPGQGTTFYIHFPNFSKTDPQ